MKKSQDFGNANRYMVKIGEIFVHVVCEHPLTLSSVHLRISTININLKDQLHCFKMDNFEPWLVYKIKYLVYT